MSIMETATSMIAFLTFLAVLFTMINYLYQTKDIGFIEMTLFVVIYININLLFLLYLKRKL